MNFNFGFRRHASLALRIALASVLFGLVVAGGAIAVGVWTLSHQLDERAGTEMEGRRQLLAHILSEVPSIDVVKGSVPRFAELFYGHDDLHLALVRPGTAQAVVEFSVVATESVAALRNAGMGPRGLHSWIRPNGERFSGIHGSASLADGRQLDFYLSMDRRRDSTLLRGFGKATIIALPLLLLVVGVGAGLIARTGLAPLRRFNSMAASIGTNSLHQRIPMSGLPGELADLAVEFNGMLERIDDGYRQLEDFSGDLAHEMRTPVATLLGRTQVALSKTRTLQQLREVLEGNVEELERLSALISDMLFIARADHNVTPIETEPVDLPREAQRVADYLSLLADDKDVQIHVNGAAPIVLADRLLIQRAVTNLLSNAIRHAVRHSTVTIEVASSGTNTSLAVTNEGEGIAPANLPRIFERFYRVDLARSRGEGGSGLGLAIVRSIATLHHGSVAVVSEHGRTTFTFSIPTATVHQVQTTGLSKQA